MLCRDPREGEARAVAVRQLGVIAVPLASAAGALESLDHGGGLIPDLILFDDVGEEMAAVRFAAALATGLRELAPPVIYIATSRETAESLTSPPLRRGRDVVLRRPLRARDVMKASLTLLRWSVEQGSVLHAGGLALDLGWRTLAYRGRSVRLTRLECGFLEYVMRHTGRAATTDELLEHVWGFEPGTGSPDVIRHRVLYLRRKLEFLGAPRDLIRTLAGRGYQLREDPESQPPGAIDPSLPVTV